MRERGWVQCDFVFVSGDSYVDHPSFASALLGRLLESEGYKVGIIAQPDAANPASFVALGKPRLAFLVGSGAMDSMVSNYTASRKPRSDDAYSPGGKAGRRPDRAVIRYCAAIREACKGATIIIGGIEASLRRLSHYDYWQDTIRKPILWDSKADLLVYGMGERALLEIASRLSAGTPCKELRDIPGTAWSCSDRRTAEALVASGAVLLPSHEGQKKDALLFAAAYKAQSMNADPIGGRALIEPESEAGGRWMVQNPPALPADRALLDRIYGLPFTKRAHPSAAALGGVPALEEVRFSITSSRGCFGACSFCAIGLHQGRIVSSRSIESMVAEARALMLLPEWKGYIHDLSGPTANFRLPACDGQAERGSCKEKACLGPEPCSNLQVDHGDFIRALRALRALPGVKKVFVRSGIRFDYLMLDPDPSLLDELCEHHVSGQLKVAPEHVSEKVLRLMGKPLLPVYEAFRKRWEEANKRLGKRQYLIPYYISGHPGSGLAEAIELAVYLKRTGFVPDQAQDFYPTPGTRSSVMWHSGVDPISGESVYVPRGEGERGLQRALLHFNKKENAAKVIEALQKAGRTDLIGSGPDCLISSKRAEFGPFE
jgi:uncharacterized radical SAM protein YgiQ